MVRRIFALLLMIALLVPLVSADQVLYLNFDDISYNVEQGGSIIVSFPSNVCAVGLTIYPTAPYVDVTINSHTFYRSVYVSVWQIPIHICSNTFSISISQHAYINGTLIPLGYSKKVVLVTTSPSSPILHMLTVYSPYIPPGINGTNGLLLNHTQITLSQTFNLTSGTIAFYLKWDGHDATILSDEGKAAVYISNGTLVVNSTSGEFKYPSSIPVGQYVPVYIGFKNGEGYIRVNNSKVSLLWSGNLVFNQIGNVNKGTSTIIDGLRVFNTYIPPDLVGLASQTQQYHILVSGRTLTVIPEGGTTLGLIDVTFLGQNYTALNTTTLGPSSSLAIAPNGTLALALSRAGISRIYWLGNYSTIAFPAENVKLITTHITVTPEQFDYLTVKTLDGTIATRIKLQDNQGDFVAVYGAQYIFTFEKGNITRSRVYTVATSNLVFYLTTSQFSLQPPLDFQAYYDQKTGLVWILFEDASGATRWLNITLTGYQNYAKAWVIHDFENRSYGLYIMTANSTGTDYVVARLTADINGSVQTFERTVYVGTGGATRPPFPTSLVPPAFIMLTAALLGIFVFPGTAPALMLLGGATSLGLLTVLGWIPATPGLITTLTLLGVLALVVYRRD